MVLLEILDLIVRIEIFFTNNDEEYCVGDGQGSDVHEPRGEA